MRVSRNRDNAAGLADTTDVGPTESTRARDCRPRRGSRSRNGDPAVIGYTRVSSESQALSGAGLAAQRAAVEAHAQRHGLQMTAWRSDEAISGTVHPLQRPGLSAALAELAERGGVLIVAKSDRIARRASDLLALIDRAEAEGWQIVATDQSVDTSSPAAKMLTTVMAGVAELERSLIAQRTREALAARRAAGVRLGPPVQLAQATRARVALMREAGATMQQIADTLNAEGVATARGGRWYPSTVKATLVSLERDSYAETRRAS